METDIQDPRDSASRPLGSWRGSDGPSWWLPSDPQTAQPWAALLHSPFPALQDHAISSASALLSCGPRAQGNRGADQENWQPPELLRLSGLLLLPSEQKTQACLQIGLARNPGGGLIAELRTSVFSVTLSTGIDHSELSQELNTGYQGREEAGGGVGEGATSLSFYWSKRSM